MSLEKHHMRSLCFSSSGLHVLFVLLRSFVRWDVSGRTDVVSWCVSFRICLLYSSWHSCQVPKELFLFCFCFFFVNVHVVNPCRSIYTITAWKKSCFISSDRSDFYMIDNLSITVNAFARRMLTSNTVEVH